MSDIEDIKAYHVRDFCSAVGISRSTFWKYAKVGKLRLIRVGRRVLVPRAEAVRFLNEGVQG
jgi:excisionase family DNA binding protein